MTEKKPKQKQNHRTNPCSKKANKKKKTHSRKRASFLKPKKEERKIERLTVGSSELGDGVDEALVKVSCPSKARLWVGCEDETGIYTKIGRMDLIIG